LIAQEAAMVRGTPTSLEAIRSFLVGIDGTEAASNALAVTCEIAKRSHASVAALHVIEVPRSLPVDAELAGELERGENIVNGAERLAGRYDLRIDGRILQARNAGAAVVDEAIALGVDAVVLGLDYHRPYGRFELGSLPQFVLENAPMQVWLIRYPPVPGDLPQ
jgi:nucleotide-binding universal stress UspA family protein